MAGDQVKRRIAPHATGWPDAVAAALRISAWEARVGVSLPRTYWDFMITYDGGRVFPAIFDVAVPDDRWGAAGKETFCDPFLAWDTAIARWNGDLFGDKTPQGFFFIAEDGFGLDLLMSLRPKDNGAIYCWQGAQVAWGQPGNDDATLYRQAPDFTAFIAQLYEVPAGDAFAFWNRPNYDIIARDLILT
jgi:SMI1 / KNR4 family (SUKH-1)